MNTLDTFFAWFTDATVRGTLLALGVLALQAALRGRMPARWRYALWLPVVIVLAAPWLPQSRWSLENRFAPAVVRVEPAPPTAAVEGQMLSSEPPPMPPVSAPVPRTDWRRLAQVGWLTGSAGVLVLALAAYARTMRRMRRAQVPADESVVTMISEATQASGLQRAPQLLVSAAVESPAVTGFWRPLLLLPADFPGAFTRDEARLVLLHELAHLKRHDLPLNWFLCLLQAIHWCNPILWFAFARMRTDREAACDARVLALTGSDARAVYGHALIKLGGSLPRPGFRLGFVGIFESTAGLRTRIRAVTGYRSAHPAWGILGAALIAGLIVAGATRAQAPATGKAAPASQTAPANPEPAAAKQVELATAGIQRKLNAFIIPRLEFREATVEDALNHLARRSVELDTSEPDAANRGVNIILNLAAPLDPDRQTAVESVNHASARITVALSNIPLREALNYVTSLANLKFRIQAKAVEVVPQNALDPLLAREWNLSAEVRRQLGTSPAQSLVASGVPFPKGAAAVLSPDGKRLLVTNSQGNLDQLDGLLAAAAPPTAASPPTSDEAANLTRKLNTIILPKLEFRDATIREAVDFLKKMSTDLDVAEPDRTKRGVNFVLRIEDTPRTSPPLPAIPGLEPFPSLPPPPTATPVPRLTVSLRNIPLMEALKYVTGLANLKFKVEPFAVAILPVNTTTPLLITKEWKLDERSAAALGIVGGQNATTALTTKGVTFLHGATATWIPIGRRLVMRNTEENFDVVERFIHAAR